MAFFLTEIGLEGRTESQELAGTLSLALRKRRPSKASSACVRMHEVALAEHEHVDFSSLLMETTELKDQSDSMPLDELRRMIRRTRARLDSQTEIVQGYLHDVHQIQRREEEFESTPKALQARALSTPRSSLGVRISTRRPASAGATTGSRHLLSRPPSALAAVSRGVAYRSEPEVPEQSALLDIMRPRSDHVPLSLPPRRPPPEVLVRAVGSCPRRPRTAGSLTSFRGPVRPRGSELEGAPSGNLHSLMPSQAQRGASGAQDGVRRR
uniref:Uncharacterized protein n=1 Tax=Noctiluca scintillans TaxID=2966 RepID=A0A7S1AZP3_NOCSC|mmetsp:Transcript_7121/g.19528  ORF Transcript_7121/g.19528 Transcript_7121/m.19528 type:complete len:268 (+) Transcript_7121:69-872(+)